MGPLRRAKEKGLRNLQSRRNNNHDYHNISGIEGSNCVICLDKIDCRGKISVCPHWFCFYCIYEWSKKTNTCPLCKARFRCITKITLGNQLVPHQSFRIKDKEQSILYQDDDYNVAMGLFDEATSSSGESNGLDETFRPRYRIRPDCNTTMVQLRPRLEPTSNGHSSQRLSQESRPERHTHQQHSADQISQFTTTLRRRQECTVVLERTELESTSGGESTDSADEEESESNFTVKSERDEGGVSDPQQQHQQQQHHRQHRQQRQVQKPTKRKRKRKSIVYKPPARTAKVQSSIQGWIDMSFKCRRSSRVQKARLNFDHHHHQVTTTTTSSSSSRCQRKAKIRGLERLRNNTSFSDTFSCSMNSQEVSRKQKYYFDGDSDSESETNSDSDNSGLTILAKKVRRIEDSESESENEAMTVKLNDLRGSSPASFTREIKTRNVVEKTQRIYFDDSESETESDIECDILEEVGNNNDNLIARSGIKKSSNNYKWRKKKSIVSPKKSILAGLSTPTNTHLKSSFKRNRMKQSEHVINTSFASITSDDIGDFDGFEFLNNNEELSPCILSQNSILQTSPNFKSDVTDHVDTTSNNNKFPHRTGGVFAVDSKIHLASGTSLFSGRHGNAYANFRRCNFPSLIKKSGSPVGCSSSSYIVTTPEKYSARRM